MTDQITVVGNVANDPAPGALPNGAPTLRFRLASNRRRYDREKNGWVEDAPNWYSVTAFRSLAANAQSSLAKGMRVIVTGRLRVRPWESQSGNRGTEVEIIADALGTDLMFGTTSFQRVQPQAAWAPGPSQDAGGPGGQESWAVAAPGDGAGVSTGAAGDDEGGDAWRAPGTSPGPAQETPF